MDELTPPPWRVFDAPATEPGMPAGAAPSTPASRADILDRLRTAPLALVAGGLLGVGGILVAAALALGGADGGVDVGSAGVLGSPRASGETVASGSEVVVDVAGAVLRPGVYHLPPGSRIGDAIAAAGGYSPRVAADLASRQLNLAAVVHDGDQVVVPSRDDAAPTGVSGAGGSGGGSGGGGGGSLVDLNRASADALDALPGIGPVTAAKIIAARQSQPFSSVQDLLDRKLVGQKVFDEIKSLVTT